MKHATCESDRLYEALSRDTWRNPRITRASRHAPFGASAMRGRLAHRVTTVAIYWGSDGPVIGGRFACGGDTKYLTLFHDLPVEMPRCVPCGLWEAHQIGPRVVYFAQRGDLIKIGCTEHVGLRMGTLHSALLATEPGGFDREAVLHERFAEARAVGEWFRPTEELLRYIERLA